MELKIYLKKRQLFDLNSNPIHLVGSTPQSLSVQTGMIANNNWVDYTDDFSDLDEISITYTELRDETGSENDAGVTFTRKGASGNLEVSGDAYLFMKSWLLDDVASPFNAISVKLVDVGCGQYIEWSVTRAQVEFCENEVCEFNVTLQKEDVPYHCIQKTIISDNHSGMFQANPTNGKKHPRFSYCNDPKNTGGILIGWYVLLTLVLSFGGILLLVAIALNPIFVFLNNLQGTLCNTFGIACGWNLPQPITIGNTTDAIAEIMMESAGCGREHPAALVRDYIKNVCDKCGVAVDESTAPIFFSQTISMSASSGYLNGVQNPHYNATYFVPTQKRGIRRYKNFAAIIFFQQPDVTTFYDVDNKPILALSDFLDQLSTIYNAAWRIKNINNIPTLFFLRKDQFYSGQYLYNFSAGHPDREKILRGMCFEPYELKFPAAVNGMYGQDGVDSCSAEAAPSYNGNTYNFGWLSDSIPNANGFVQSNTEYFAATRFELDGAEGSNLYDMFQTIVNFGGNLVGSLFALNPFAPAEMNSIFNALADFYLKYVDYSILLSDEQVGKPRIVIWDGSDYLNARALINKTGYTTQFSFAPEPTPNVNYNNIPFQLLHPRDTFVRGRNMNLGGFTPGVFTVKRIDGHTYKLAPCMLPNFPMYFNPGYKDTLWDWFWFIDDPTIDPKMGMRWEVEIENCCEDLQILGVFNSGDDVKLGDLVKLPLQFYPDGRITEIEVNYSVQAEIGRTIKLKGIC